jgi:hypothetical protein
VPQKVVRSAYGGLTSDGLTAEAIAVVVAKPAHDPPGAMVKAVDGLPKDATHPFSVNPFG